MSDLLIENGTIHTGHETMHGGAVLVSGGTIEAVFPSGESRIPPPIRRIDARGGHVVPGFIDMHTHGALGYDLHNATVTEMRRIAEFEASHGVTAFLPTTVSASLDAMLCAIELARQAMHLPLAGGARVLGIHIEGPYLDREMRGAHLEKQIRDPQPREIERLLQHADVIRSVTLAPERPGALDSIRAFVSHGILVSAGHTQAIEPDLNKAIEAGLRHVTHIFGNMSTLRRHNLTRVAGTVETALYDDRLTTEVIGDGHHISSGLMRLVFACKGWERLALISDASPLTGLPSGSYHVWGTEVVVDGDICFLPDRSAFAGSLAPMDVCLRNLIRMAGVSLDDALRTATLTPARILGLSDHKGTLERGKDADMVILDDALTVTHTFVGGNPVFSLGS